MKTYNLICMDFSGDYITEREGFESIADAWEHAEDMGSRWFFRPFCFVTTASGSTIADTPELLQQFKGKRVATVQKVFESLSEQEETQGMDIEQYVYELSAIRV